MATVYSDIIQTSDLPDSMRVIYSQELEFTTRPLTIVNQPAFVEIWPEHGAKRGSTVTRTVYHQLPNAIAPLAENTDVDGGAIDDHQVSLKVFEYGNSIGTSEQLDLLSYHGPISNIVRTLLAPQVTQTLDTIARNALWYGQTGGSTPKFKTYANSNTKTVRADLATTDNMSADMARAIGYRLGVRNIPTLGEQEPAYVAMAHPAVVYDLRNDSNWKDANLYAGATRIFNGEEGSIHGVRFLKSPRLRIANGGALIVQTTLAAGTYSRHTNQVTVTAATNFTVGMEVTIHKTGDSTTHAPLAGGTAVTWTAPNGKDPVEETLIISNIAGTTVTFQTNLQYTHSGGEYMTEALDVYPVAFVGGIPPLGKGSVIEPEIRVALPTDKLRRMSYVGWYTLIGFGVVRDWAYELLELAASQNVAPVYGSTQ